MASTFRIASNNVENLFERPRAMNVGTWAEAKPSEIFARLVAGGQAAVAVVGDFHDTPDSAPLAPLLAGTDLRDVSTHPKFVSDGYVGTFGNGTKGEKSTTSCCRRRCSRAWRTRASSARRVWGGKNGTLWPIYPTKRAKVHQASDHAAIYADLKL